MKVIKFSERSGLWAYLDMSGRSRPKGVQGNVFRLGDRAAAHLWVLNWRKLNPTARILIIDDPFWSAANNAYHLDAEWCFKGIADELWIADKPGEELALPTGQVLYHVNLWRIWRWLRLNKQTSPTIRPTDKSLERADNLLKKYRVPVNFVTVQPLFDASYNTHRNSSIYWWQQAIAAVARRFPVVVLGAAANVQSSFRGTNIFPLWNEQLTPMDSLALISKAGAHVGGETGLTLWASMLHVPLVAVYATWRDTRTDTRPIEFKARVYFLPLACSAYDVLRSVSYAMSPRKILNARR